VDGAEVHLQSRNGRPLTRYFPELAFADDRVVLDGEIVILGPDGRQLFDTLGQRIHPAASRIELLSKETPARFVAFDLLANGDDVLLELPYDERRAALEAYVAELDEPTFDLTPVVHAASDAEGWLRGAEGVIAKERGAPYKPGERTGMVKVKRVRTIDAVVMGWRPGKAEGTVGSLILGLYGDDGQLHGVGHTSGFRAAEKRALVEKLKPYETGERGMGDPSRWASDRELEWIAVRPELVVEVSFDHVSDGRIRHGTKVLRWRDDRDPASCHLSQLEG
jgi:ATP-dependent DNA ligase